MEDHPQSRRNQANLGNCVGEGDHLKRNCGAVPVNTFVDGAHPQSGWGWELPLVEGREVAEERDGYGVGN